MRERGRRPKWWWKESPRPQLEPPSETPLQVGAGHKAQRVLSKKIVLIEYSSLRRFTGGKNNYVKNYANGNDNNSNNNDDKNFQLPKKQICKRENVSCYTLCVSAGNRAYMIITEEVSNT